MNPEPDLIERISKARYQVKRNLHLRRLEGVCYGAVGYTSEMLLRIPFLAMSLAAVAAAQNPYENLPRNYQLELENGYVRVSRVKYFPGDKLAVRRYSRGCSVQSQREDGDARNGVSG
jgi:hypothetical protein